jgi:hypothetical protein
MKNIFLFGADKPVSIRNCLEAFAMTTERECRIIFGNVFFIPKGIEPTEVLGKRISEGCRLPEANKGL